MTPCTDQTPRIAVAGGGPGGLLCARVLQRRGIPVTVYEADAAVDARDAGGTLDLHADTGQIAIEEAGLTSKFFALARHEGQAKARRDHHGTLLAAFAPQADDDAAPEIDRGQLRRLLVESLDPGTVRWGHRLREAVPLDGGRHRLTFANGATDDVDLLIGADGVWSKVRPLLTDATPRYTGVSYVECRYDDVDRRHPEVGALVGDGHLFSGDGAGRAIILQRNSGGVVRGYVMFTAALEWAEEAGVDPGDRDGVRRHLLKRFAGWDPTMRRLVAEIDGEYRNRPLWVLPAPLTWASRSGVTLLGDAAHTMAPFGGFGVNLALLDGAELALALADGDSLDSALSRYEGTMFARGGRLAVQANQALTRFFDGPFTAATAPDTEAEHRAYEAGARALASRNAEGDDHRRRDLGVVRGGAAGGARPAAGEAP